MTEFNGVTLGSGENQYMVFATGLGANVESPATWEADAVRQQGFQNGIALPSQANTIWRQVSVVAAMLTQFCADFSGQPSNDDGNVTELESNFLTAIQAALEPFGVYFILDTGTANEVIGTVGSMQVPPNAYIAPCFIIFQKVGITNSGPMTCNFFNLGQVALTDNTGHALSTGAILGSSFYMCAFSGGGFRILGGAATYTTVTDLTANSGDMIIVQTTGEVDLRILTGAHNNTPGAGDGWPRGRAADDVCQYMTTTELITWLNSTLTFPVQIEQRILASGKVRSGVLSSGIGVSAIEALGGGQYIIQFSPALPSNLHWVFLGQISDPGGSLGGWITHWQTNSDTTTAIYCVRWGLVTGTPYGVNGDFDFAIIATS